MVGKIVKFLIFSRALIIKNVDQFFQDFFYSVATDFINNYTILYNLENL